MKKFIMLSAVLAAVSTAFVACSSDDDLAQAPAVPEESVVDTPQGTPFSVNPSSGATRAIRYGSSAWNGNSDTYVNCFKLYGNQTDLSNVWVKNVVFTRSAKDAAWVADRDDDGSVASLNWPKDKEATPAIVESDKSTDFYAITDNAIKGQGDDNELTGVTSWLTLSQTTGESPVNIGTFHYSLQTKEQAIPWIDTSYPGLLTNFDDTDGTPDPEIEIVDPADDKLLDLMYATTSKKESETTNGQLPLQFHHALSGLSVQAKFLSKADLGAGGWAIVKAVTICGLKTAGDFTMTPSAGTGAWSSQATLVNYHYELPTAKKLDAEDDQDDDVVANPTTKELVPVGEWLVIPQTTTPWNLSYNNALLPNAANGAYIILRVEEYKNEGLESFLIFPLNTKLNAGKNRVITVDIAQGREYYASTNENASHNPKICDLHFQPSQASGSTNPSREYTMDEEDF